MSPTRPLADLSNQKVRTRDGVLLATDVYFPPGYRPGTDAALPVILERTPYGKADISRSEQLGGVQGQPRPDIARYFAQHGFAVVFQDCRGRYDSEGQFTKYLSEGEDGYDTMAWITAQPWCNGRIGTMGLSYGAHTQMALACLNPPGLACMVLDSGGFSNGYQCGIRQSGAFELKQATWAYKQAKLSPAAQEDPVVLAALEAQDIRQWFMRMPWRPGHSPLSAVPEYEDYLFEQWRAECFDESWRQLGIYAQGYYDAIPDIPVVLMSSWYDAYVRTTMENFEGLGAGRNAPLRLIMGPWLHGDRNITHSGDAEFGAAAAFDGHIARNWLEFRLAWFRRWLQQDASPAAADPVARLFLMGGGSGRRDAQGRFEHGGQWVQAATWPVPQARPTPYFLHADGGLRREPPQAQDARIRYQADPRRPVPTIGGALTSGQPVFVGGGFDQREDARFFGIEQAGLPLASRDDVVVFQTEPLEQDLAVVGPVVVRLSISSDCPDTDFTAKLIDVYPANPDYPEGYALNLTDGIFRCRFHESWEKPAALEPGKVYEITIEPFATCNLFKRGHRIRLDISSSNFPKYDVNPNSGETAADAREKRVALNTLHLSPVHGCSVTLHIADPQALTPLPAP
ncbi:Cocaine esterase [Achromobacter anxifer]|jgi:putative CocE/NonD family hydrolase|uniref:Cocaine esterase n=1 Tax=Achromobacter anxifer TaxID=1287737 RepID=A0A6S7CDP2_9BURK|nr:CocE/NonD family hydrolase [Achromobacter anxifer]CAB3843373.1 Cocaine esterase [Achromobacter anxifer]CAB5515877.1 Cocaine esterase [Achromobacter anxifer]